MLSSKSLALAALSAALMIAALVPAAASAQRLTTSGAPNFGARTIAPGFTPDPIQIPVTSGGTLNVSQMNMGQNCTGFATAQPDFNCTLTGTSAFLRVYVEAGNEDTTLIINRANNAWACNDDSNGTTNRNPMVDMTNAGPGLYNVWIGSYATGTRARGTLNITGSTITSSGGAISFSDDNLSTSGTIGGGAITGTPTLQTVANVSIDETFAVTAVASARAA